MMCLRVRGDERRRQDEGGTYVVSCLDNPGTGGEAEVRWPAGRRGQSHHKIPEVAAMDSRRQHRRRQGPLTLADAYYVTPGPPDAGRV